MKDYQYHLINSGIAGGLVTLGSLTPIFTGEFSWKGLSIGIGIGIISGTIIFLNKFNEWFQTQDPDCKKRIFNLI